MKFTSQYDHYNNKLQTEIVAKQKKNENTTSEIQTVKREHGVVASSNDREN